MKNHLRFLTFSWEIQKGILAWNGLKALNPLSASPAKWSNTLKQLTGAWYCENYLLFTKVSIYLSILTRNHSFSPYAKFSEKPSFLIPRYAHVSVSGGKKCQFWENFTFLLIEWSPSFFQEKILSFVLSASWDGINFLRWYPLKNEIDWKHYHLGQLFLFS